MEKNKETKTLSPKLDVVFQALFGEIGNERITKGFLETILKRKIESIDLSKNPILRREFKDDKLGVLDILVELDGKEKCNIEMQLIDQSNIIERILYYWSRLYTRQIKTGEDYSLLEKTIVILITDFEVKNLKETKNFSKTKDVISKNNSKTEIELITAYAQLAFHTLKNSNTDITAKSIKEEVTMFYEKFGNTEVKRLANIIMKEKKEKK
jgi:predicted transposase/invertase (TIGR01784 family)